jgi:hypothetical protein
MAIVAARIRSSALAGASLAEAATFACQNDCSGIQIICLDATLTSPTDGGDMRYALLIYDLPGNYDELPDDERTAVFGEYSAISESPGVYGGAWLQPVDTATTLRVEDGAATTTDGPFAETKEFLGGFYLLEADDPDAALELAKRVPAARLGGAIEVRPLVEAG